MTFWSELLTARFALGSCQEQIRRCRRRLKGAEVGALRSWTAAAAGARHGARMRERRGDQVRRALILSRHLHQQQAGYRAEGWPYQQVLLAHDFSQAKVWTAESAKA